MTTSREPAALLEGLFSLAGRTALITGGSKGIGKLIATAFLEQGATVIISSRNAAACDAAAAELRTRGKCISMPYDLSKSSGVRLLAEAVRDSVSALDILINNAGTSWGASLQEFPEAGWDKVMDVNLKSPFFLIQALLPALKAAATADKPAKVINIASIDGLALSPNSTYSYFASKSALIFLTRRLAAELIRDHLVMNAIAPGHFPSDLNRLARDHEAKIAARIPAGRIGKSEDIAGCAVFLASRAGDYIVGETVAVDGGLTYANIPPAFR